MALFLVFGPSSKVHILCSTLAKSIKLIHKQNIHLIIHNQANKLMHTSRTKVYTLKAQTLTHINICMHFRHKFIPLILNTHTLIIHVYHMIITCTFHNRKVQINFNVFYALYLVSGLNFKSFEKLNVSLIESIQFIS